MHLIHRILLATCLLLSGLAVTPTASATPAITAWGDAQVANLSSSRPTRTYAFETDSALTARFVLGDLPMNYDMELATQDGTVLQSSKQKGRRYDEIIHELKAGTYRVTVSSPSGDFSDKPFRLIGRRYLKPAVLSRSLKKDSECCGDDNWYSVEYINPTDSPVKMRGVVEFYDDRGGFLGQERLSTIKIAMPGRKGVSSLDGYGFGTYEGDVKTAKLVKVRFPKMDCPKKQFGAISKLDIVREEAGEFDISGLLYNPHRRETSYSLVSIQYDARGNILENASAWVDDVPGRRKVSFDEHHSYFNRSTVNRWGVTAYVSWGDDLACTVA